MHSWLLGDDVAVLIIPVPTATSWTVKTARVLYYITWRLAEETSEVAVASKQGRHM